jgi:hypothetical protein
LELDPIGFDPEIRTPESPKFIERLVGVELKAKADPVPGEIPDPAIPQ